MHLLATSSLSLDDLDTPVDLNQSPADVAVLSFAENDLLGVAAGWRRLEAEGAAGSADGAAGSEGRTLCLTCLRDLRHPLSVDLWIERVGRFAKVIVVRLLGGLGAWRYGCEQLARACRETGAGLFLLPGECGAAQTGLEALSTGSKQEAASLLACFREGGPENMDALARTLVRLTGAPVPGAGLRTLPKVGLYFPGRGTVGPGVDDFRLPHHPDAPVVPLLLYRSMLLTDDVAPIDALFHALRQRGIACVPIFVGSLKTSACLEALEPLLRRITPEALITATAFTGALDDSGKTLFDRLDVPVFQVIVATTRREAWESGIRGLTPADLAMHVVLPELDGRLLAGAVSFKDADPALQAYGFSGLTNAPPPDRVDHIADRIAAFLRLKRTPRSDRSVLILMPHYPGVPGRTGYAVGLDVPESVLEALHSLKRAGYDVRDIPANARALLDRLREPSAGVSIDLYRRWLETLEPENRDALTAAWGAPEDDDDITPAGFAFQAARFGSVTVALPPDRGRFDTRRVDYHDAALVPRHALLAFGVWMRSVLRCDAVVHMGAHGVLEWLPGKTVALSRTCFPELVCGALPVIYPFIVSNPGEAAVAKRRIGAVTIGHLPPPLVAAEPDEPRQHLERLVDEYAQADGLDGRRRDRLARLIVTTARETGIADRVGLGRIDEPDEALRRIDAWLCDLKDVAVRDGLHVFGRTPAGETDPLRITSAERERDALLDALDGRRIAPGPAGAPLRGRQDVLPTGRNLYAADPRTMPTPTAFELGALAGEDAVRHYLQDHGEPPRRLMIDLWGSATLRTGGEELAQGLALMGCRPRWNAITGRVDGIDVLPPAALKYPRVDITFRLSGLFRDMFPALIVLLNAAVRAVAARAESAAENPLAAEARARGGTPLRVFGGAPGAYGAGIEDLLASGQWSDRTDLGAAYLDGGAYAYETTDGEGLPAPEAFAERVRTSDALLHTGDDPGRDILDGSADVGFIGGFAAAVQTLGGAADLILLDTTNPNRLRARSLTATLTRVVYGRAVDRRYIDGQMRHGPRGAQDFLETVDRLINFAETTDAVPPALIDAVFDAYVCDDRVRAFLLDQAPESALVMARRFLAARARGRWPSRRNAIDHDLEALRDAALEAVERQHGTPRL